MFNDVNASVMMFLLYELRDYELDDRRLVNGRYYLGMLLSAPFDSSNLYIFVRS